MKLYHPEVLNADTLSGLFKILSDIRKGNTKHGETEKILIEGHVHILNKNEDVITPFKIELKGFDHRNNPDLKKDIILNMVITSKKEENVEYTFLKALARKVDLVEFAPDRSMISKNIGVVNGHYYFNDDNEKGYTIYSQDGMEDKKVMTRELVINENDISKMMDIISKAMKGKLGIIEKDKKNNLEKY